MPQMGKGCSVIEDSELRNQCNQLFKGKHSWRGYQDTDFTELWEACKQDAETPDEKLECGVTVRRGLQRIESGRFDKFLEEANRFWYPLDPDEQEDFAEKHPELVKRIDEWAVVQESRRVDDKIMKQVRK